MIKSCHVSQPDFSCGELVSLKDFYVSEGYEERQPWETGTFGVILSVDLITDESPHHYEIRVLTNDDRIWTIDPGEIKEKL